MIQFLQYQFHYCTGNRWSHWCSFRLLIHSVTKCEACSFAVEEESLRVLQLLDVLVWHYTNGRFLTNVYRKEPNTNHVLPFESNNRVSHKIGCIKYLFNPIDSHCGTHKAQTEEQRQLYDICQWNGYSISFIQRCSGPQHRQFTEKPASRWH